MFWTLVKKEITETMLDLRFWVVTALLLILIPLGTYVSRKDYERRLDNYQREYQMYRQRYGNNVNAYVQAQGFRPPSVLSIFALGLDPFMPDRVVTARSGLFEVIKEADVDNPQSLLFGKVDFLFSVGFIVSMAALIFTFNRISGEKEMGTLRLMISNPVGRAEILLAKTVGNYVVLLIPFIIALLIALLILEMSPVISIGSSMLWPAVLVIGGITLLFMLVMVCLGVCVSTLAYSSITAIMITFLVWIIFVLGVPKISPMIAEVFYPIESKSVVNLTQRIAREDIEKEFDQKKRELFEACRREFGVTLDGISSRPRNEAEKKAYEKYDREVVTVGEECEKRIANAVKQIEQDYANRRHVQASLAINLSRISPVSCYTYLISGLSNTGMSELGKFDENADRYQDEVTKTIYDNFIIKVYTAKGGSASTTDTVEGFDRFRASIPEMKYQYTTMTESLQRGWVDILVLCLFNILFFGVAFLKFCRYDVR